jgi:hypothetical protein
LVTPRGDFDVAKVFAALGLDPNADATIEALHLSGAQDLPRVSEFLNDLLQSFVGW